jgi:integrase
MITTIFEGPDTATTGRAPKPSPVTAYLDSLEMPSSQRTMKGTLKSVALSLGAADVAAVDWAAFDVATAMAFRARLAERVRKGTVAPLSANLRIAAIRGVLKTACLMDLITTGQLHKLGVVLKPFHGTTRRVGRALGHEEIGGLFAYCGRQQEPLRSRNLALLAVLLVGGLRRSEVVALDLADWHPAERALTFLGKGQKPRTVYVSHQAAHYIQAWVRVRGAHEGPLFHPMTPRRTIAVRRCSNEAVYEFLERTSRHARIEAVRPHDCRRTMVSSLLGASTDVLTVMRQSGHSSARLVQAYDRRPDAAQRRAVELLACPVVIDGTDSGERTPVGEAE